MSFIAKIDVKIITGDRPGAETAGRVYLGIGGREFCLSTGANDFGRNTRQIFTLGEDANINQAADNDPRTPYALHTEELPHFPLYCEILALYGWETIGRLAATDPAQESMLRLVVETVTIGLDHSDRLLGCLWVLLTSWAALRSGQLAKPLSFLGVAIGIAGIVF